ncbi:unnamed protein product [Protopolystoma xenopodis]|uniref:Uncharacterized protein n=1 Tax=Protopolystoma xenopodis TaxID=117903 RepID=A0A3S5A4E8_9PLAT|nr:unnamed protein product [Protopolystoma xenopodis]
MCTELSLLSARLMGENVVVTGAGAEVARSIATGANSASATTASEDASGSVFYWPGAGCPSKSVKLARTLQNQISFCRFFHFTNRGVTSPGIFENSRTYELSIVAPQRWLHN